jgi:hypothetical protein
VTPQAPLYFRPRHGLIRVAERLVSALGLQHLWEGPDGLEAVVSDKLQEMKVPAKPIQLTGEGSVLTPRAVAEQAGFIRKKRNVRRVKGA